MDLERCASDREGRQKAGAFCGGEKGIKSSR